MVLYLRDLDPVGHAVLHANPADQVPEARDDMVQHEHRHQQLAQVDDDEGVLTLDHVVEQVDDPLELQQPQQPQDADGARPLDKLDHLAGLPALLVGGRAENRHEPLRHDDHGIGEEPSHHVVPQDLAVVGDVLALLEVAKEEALAHVRCPEEQGGPVHGHAEPRVPRFEGQGQRNGDKVIADEDQPGEVPRETEGAVRVDGAAACVVLDFDLRAVLDRLGLRTRCHGSEDGLAHRLVSLPSSAIP
mmetsp:Transcript_24883/g.67986  ORF Transcript_24883/g.67986 Transcript_24883/m.67986 type:complete len:246 (+) Transcript_24883:1164-1901(+)